MQGKIIKHDLQCRIQGRARGPCPPLIFGPPLISGSGWPGPPKLKVWIRHWFRTSCTDLRVRITLQSKINSIFTAKYCSLDCESDSSKTDSIAITVWLKSFYLMWCESSCPQWWSKSVRWATNHQLPSASLFINKTGCQMLKDDDNRVFILLDEKLKDILEWKATQK